MILYIYDKNLENLNKEQKEEINYELNIFERFTYTRFQCFCATYAYIYFKKLIKENKENYEFINENGNLINIKKIFNSIKLKSPNDQNKILILFQDNLEDYREILLSINFYGLKHILNKIKTSTSLFSVGYCYDILYFLNIIKNSDNINYFKFYNDVDKELIYQLLHELIHLCHLSIKYNLPIIIENF